MRLYHCEKYNPKALLCIQITISDVVKFVASECAGWPDHVRSDDSGSRVGLRGNRQELRVQRNQGLLCQGHPGDISTLSDLNYKLFILMIDQNEVVQD